MLPHLQVHIYKDEKAKTIVSLKQGTGKYAKSSRSSCFSKMWYRCGPQWGRGHWSFNEEKKLIPIKHMERIQLCVRGEMVSIIVVTSELKEIISKARVCWFPMSKTLLLCLNPSSD